MDEPWLVLPEPVIEDGEELNIFELIIREMIDDDDGYRQNYKFIRMYEEADDATKAIIDRALIMLCGWSFSTLTHMAKGEVKVAVNQGTPEAPFGMISG
jgi:hypothetical protein